MFWTCVSCGNQNDETFDCCIFCGEPRFVTAPSQASAEISQSIIKSEPTSDLETEKITSMDNLLNSNYFSEAEDSFKQQLEPAKLKSLRKCALFCRISSFICYLFAVLFLSSLSAETSQSNLLIIMNCLPPLCFFVIGFIFKIVHEVLILFIHGNKSWFLNAKYSYVNSKLTNELLKKIDLLEEQMAQLSKSNSKS